MKGILFVLVFLNVVRKWKKFVILKYYKIIFYYLLFFVAQNMRHTCQKPTKMLSIYRDFQTQLGQVWRNVRKEKYLKNIEHLIMPGQIHLRLPLMRVAYQYA